MPALHPRRTSPKLAWAACIALAALGTPFRSQAFVFLDTSAPVKPAATDSAILPSPSPPSPPASLPADSPSSRPPSNPASAPLAAPVTGGGPKRLSVPHYGNVMFMSADDKMVYAYLGVWKALEEFGIAPDAMLAESKAVLLAAAWSLGYRAVKVEAEWLRHPLEGYLKPDPYPDAPSRNDILTAGPDPIQWEIPLGLQTLQTPGSGWSDVTSGGGGEYLHLSWLVARLTHDAPAGPVEELSKAPRPLAIQATDLSTEQPTVLTEGSLQNIIKGSLLPTGVIRNRPRLWPYASGALLSGHTVMKEKLPFTYDRLILLQPGHRLRPPGLESGPVTWTDSLNLRTLRRNSGATGRDGGAPGEGSRIIRIELEPEGVFDPQETDPAQWVRLGYISALRSMDVLQSVLAHDPVRGGSGHGALSDGTGAIRATRATRAKGGQVGYGRLDLNRLSVNPLASGGRQLLLDIIRVSDRDQEDSSGEKAISALTGSGFYSDLDVEWTRDPGDESPVLVFDAREKSKIRFRSGWNAVFAGEDLPYRTPELYGGLDWSEPFYIPFQGELGALFGGHRPGYEARLMIAPVYPLHLELGVSWVHRELFHPLQSGPKAADQAGAEAVRLNRTLSEVFLKIFPFPFLYLRTAIQKHEMTDLIESDPNIRKYLSTDFQETAYVGLGAPDRGGLFPHSLSLRYKNLNRVNLFGPVKFSASNVEAVLKLALGDFRFSDQYFWSNQSDEDLAIFDLMEAGEIQVFTFQNEYFFSHFRSTNFQNAKVEYCPTFGKAGLRLIAGGYHNYGPALYEGQLETHPWNGMEIPFAPYWEAQAGYVTPLGTLRAGMGALDGQSPFYYVRIGAGLGLGFDGER
jgi:hypothetical protein